MYEDPIADITAEISPDLQAEIEATTYRTYFTRCSKCEVSIGQASMPDDYALEYLRGLLCESCKRVQAWLPDIVKAVKEAMRHDEAQNDGVAGSGTAEQTQRT